MLISSLLHILVSLLNAESIKVLLNMPLILIINMTGETWGQIANIVIAAGTIIGIVFSIWFSRKSLRQSEWSLNMSTVPSLTIELSSVKFWKSDSSRGGGSWGEPTHFLDFSENYITTALSFSILNQGRGVALGIEKPKIFCVIQNRIEKLDIPVSMGNTHNNSATLNIYFTEQHSKWLGFMTNPIDVAIVISYKNDQSNIYCTSRWFAKIKPFDVENTRLNIRPSGEKVLGADMTINYSPKKHNSKY